MKTQMSMLLITIIRRCTWAVDYLNAMCAYWFVFNLQFSVHSLTANFLFLKSKM